MTREPLKPSGYLWCHYFWPGHTSHWLSRVTSWWISRCKSGFCDFDASCIWCRFCTARIAEYDAWQQLFIFTRLYEVMCWGLKCFLLFPVSSDCVIRYFLSCRDGRYVVPRPASADEQHRVPQYNHMMTNRNVPQPNLTPSGALPAADRGSRLLPGVSGIGISCGVTRSMPMTRPGFQGIASSMVSSGSMHSGVGSGQGNSMLRPREPMHTMRVCSYIPF